MSDLLDSKHFSRDVKQNSIKGGLVNLLTKAVQFIMQIGSTMILARLLTPEDFGIIAMVVVFTGFAKIFSNFGLSIATVQQKNITYEQLSTCFWINFALGIGFMFLVMAMGPVAAWFYNTQELTMVMIVLAFNFFIKGLTIQHNALIMRQMQFKALSVVRIISTFLGIVSAIVFAYSGFSYWALVYSVLINSAAKAIGLWIATSWVPGPFKWSPEVRSMIKFGTDYAVFTTSEYFSKNLDNALIGRFFGSDALGLYSRAYHLLSLINRNVCAPLDTIAIAALSQLQDDPQRYHNYCTRYISILAFITMPISVFMFICADNVIQVVMGPQWTGAILIFRVFAVLSVIQSVVSIRNTILVTTGESVKLRRWGIVNSICTMIAICVGLPWGGVGVAVSFTCVSYLLIYPSLFYCLHDVTFRITNFNNAIKRALCTSILTGALCYPVKLALTNFSDLSVLICVFLAGITIYIMLFGAQVAGRRELLNYFSYFKVAIGR